MELDPELRQMLGQYNTLAQQINTDHALAELVAQGRAPDEPVKRAIDLSKRLSRWLISPSGARAPRPQHNFCLQMHKQLLDFLFEPPYTLPEMGGPADA